LENAMLEFGETLDVYLTSKPVALSPGVASTFLKVSRHGRIVMFRSLVWDLYRDDLTQTN